MRATGGEVLTEANYVVSIVFPGYLNSLHDIMTIILDFDNMLALSAENYIKWKQRTLELNDEQKQLIEHRESLIIRKYHLQLSDVIFYRATLDHSPKVQRSIKEICADVEKYLMKFEKCNESKKKMEKNKPVEVWDVETKQLVKVFESMKEASEQMQVSQSAISAICRKKQIVAKSETGRYYTFRFVGDVRALRFEVKSTEKKSVFVYDETGTQLVHKYDSIGETARKLHVSHSTLRHSLKHSGLVMVKGILYKVRLTTND